ncbi:LOW QUALITY PROTEIN: SAGA-associated factor 29-like [Pterocles gutturalis]
MALVSADSRIAELLGELHQLVKHTQVAGLWGGTSRFSPSPPPPHRLSPFLSETHERMQAENKNSPCYWPKLRGLCTSAKADVEAECNVPRKASDKIAKIESLLEERRIAAKIDGIYSEAEPLKNHAPGVLMTLLQQSAMMLPLWIGKAVKKPPPRCAAVPVASDDMAKPGDKVAARVKALEGDEQWILAEVVSYSHAANKYKVDDIDEEGLEA